MSPTQTGATTPRKPLRLWPGVVIAIVLVLARYVLPLIGPDTEILPIPLTMLGVMAGMVGGVATLIWWMFFSRAPWSERLGAPILIIAALVATSRIVHESIAGGMMGMMLAVYSIPVLSLGLIVWAVATRDLSDGGRRVSLVAIILLACAPWTLGTDGWRHRRRFGVSLAVDANSRATAADSVKQRILRRGSRYAGSASLLHDINGDFETATAGQNCRSARRQDRCTRGSAINVEGRTHGRRGDRHAGRMAGISWTRA